VHERDADIHIEREDEQNDRQMDKEMIDERKEMLSDP
jgi:hypothetical protein